MVRTKNWKAKGGITMLSQISTICWCDLERLRQVIPTWRWEADTGAHSMYLTKLKMLKWIGFKDLAEICRWVMMKPLDFTKKSGVSELNNIQSFKTRDYTKQKDVKKSFRFFHFETIKSKKSFLVSTILFKTILFFFMQL